MQSPTKEQNSGRMVGLKRQQNSSVRTCACFHFTSLLLSKRQLRLDKSEVGTNTEKLRDLGKCQQDIDI